MLIEELVPRSVAAFETREYVAETLYPAEVAYIGSATNKRRNEFTTVGIVRARLCRLSGLSV